MDFIYNTWWLWLLIAAPLLAFPPRSRPHPVREAIMAASGILFMMSLVLHFFPRI